MSICHEHYSPFNGVSSLSWRRQLRAQWLRGYLEGRYQQLGKMQIFAFHLLSAENQSLGAWPPWLLATDIFGVSWTWPRGGLYQHMCGGWVDGKGPAQSINSRIHRLCGHMCSWHQWDLQAVWPSQVYSGLAATAQQHDKGSGKDLLRCFTTICWLFSREGSQAAGQW
jgi:hypothetical protein